MSLPGGRVLVAGGTVGAAGSASNSNGALATAELFDEARGTWSSAGSLQEARAYPGAVLLRDGRILVAGGSRDGAPLRTAELFDPSSGTWSETGAMTVSRTDFAMVTLADGRVMAIGGGTKANDGTATATTELYDPATGAWTAGSSMSRGRAYATATLLQDGRVLVAGGGSAYFSSQATVTATAELWIPATGAWVPTASMSTPRFFHAAALLPGGWVLVTGGLPAAVGSSSPVATVEAFDPTLTIWRSLPSMTDARTQHQLVVLPDGRAVALGGVGTDGTPIASTEILGSQLGSWSSAGTLPVAVWWPAAVTMSDGRVLVAGGAPDTHGEAAVTGAAVLGP